MCSGYNVPCFNDVSLVTPKTRAVLADLKRPKQLCRERNNQTRKFSIVYPQSGLSVMDTRDVPQRRGWLSEFLEKVSIISRCYTWFELQSKLSVSTHFVRTVNSAAVLELQISGAPGAFCGSMRIAVQQVHCNETVLIDSPYMTQTTLFSSIISSVAQMSNRTIRCTHAVNLKGTRRRIMIRRGWASP